MSVSKSGPTSLSPVLDTDRVSRRNPLSTVGKRLHMLWTLFSHGRGRQRFGDRRSAVFEDGCLLSEPVEKSLLDRLHRKYSGTPLVKDPEEKRAREILAYS
jgi:hypothetical protein